VTPVFRCVSCGDGNSWDANDRKTNSKWLKPLFLKFYCVYRSYITCENTGSENRSQSVGWGLRFFVPDKLSDNANVDGPSTTLGVARVLKLGWPLKHLGKLKKY